MGFKVDKLFPSLNRSIRNYDPIETTNEKLVLEFSRMMKLSNINKCRCIFAYYLNLTKDTFTTECLSTLDCLFYSIYVTPNSLKTLYDYKCELPEQQSAFTSRMLIKYDNQSLQDTNEHIINLIQKFNNIKTVAFKGEF